jgi:hypothetical protein
MQLLPLLVFLGCECCVSLLIDIHAKIACDIVVELGRTIGATLIFCRSMHITSEETCPMTMELGYSIREKLNVAGLTCS